MLLSPARFLVTIAIFVVLAAIAVPRSSALCSGQTIESVQSNGRIMTATALSEAVSSSRTLSLAVEIDRDAARLIHFTLKDHPFKPTEAPPRKIQAPAKDGTSLVELSLINVEGKRITRRVDVPVCLLHPAEAEPHVAGDTILPHRDSFVIEMPEKAGFDRLEIASVSETLGASQRHILAVEDLDSLHFSSAGGRVHYRDLIFARPHADSSPPAPMPEAPPTSGVHWPEEFGDSQVYTLVGNPAEVGKRINIIVLPEGYRYADKALIQSHFNLLMQTSTSPYFEHRSEFFNYVLVYAYSQESGASDCSCNLVKDTAFGVHFPDSPNGCGTFGCLYYGSDCTHNLERDIADGEMRAPAFDVGLGDRTLIMVNISRCAGCASFGGRAVYSAACSLSAHVAEHEFGHSFGYLQDEYVDIDNCATSAGEINTSLNAIVGAWPEWISEVGPPVEGAQHYSGCVYRPRLQCLMHSDNLVGFCPVCRQAMTLKIFDTSRVAPTAPIESATPASPLTTQTGFWNNFGLTVRLPAGPDVTNDITWRLQGPGDPTPVTVATGAPSLFRGLDFPGSYTLTATVIADSNFVKPEKTGGNLDTAAWSLNVLQGPPPGEVSPPGSLQPFLIDGLNGATWEHGSVNHSTRFNLYRGDLGSLSAGSYGTCWLGSIDSNGASIGQDSPSDGQAWFFIVTGKTGNTEGVMGFDSVGSLRINADPCQ